MNSILVSVVMVLGLVVFDNINTSLIIYGSFLNSYRAGIDFNRQNLTSIDVRFWRLKPIPAL